MGITNEQQPRQQRRTFSDELKRDAVTLVTTGGYTVATAAKSPKTGGQSLRQWHAKFAPPLEFSGEDASVAQLKAEVQRLRRELRRARTEQEILKKATACRRRLFGPCGAFAKESR